MSLNKATKDRMVDVPEKTNKKVENVKGKNREFCIPLNKIIFNTNESRYSYSMLIMGVSEYENTPTVSHLPPFFDF